MLPDRFWAKVQKTESCWQWLGYRLPSGYGRIRINNRLEYAHVVMLRETIGDIPDGYMGAWICGNTSCVRPDHLAIRLRAELAENRLRSLVEVGPDCWGWTGKRTRDGYALLSINNRQHYAHRVSYEVHVGPIPDGYQVDHLCRNRSCTNPVHLEAVPPSVNYYRQFLDPGEHLAMARSAGGQQ